MVYRESRTLIKDLAIKLKDMQKSEKEYKKQVIKLTSLNREADHKYYLLEQSKQELIKMKDNDYEEMQKKNIRLKNELTTLQKYYESQAEECKSVSSRNE